MMKVKPSYNKIVIVLKKLNRVKKHKNSITK